MWRRRAHRPVLPRRVSRGLGRGGLGLDGRPRRGLRWWILGGGRGRSGNRLGSCRWGGLGRLSGRGRCSGLGRWSGLGRRGGLGHRGGGRLAGLNRRRRRRDRCRRLARLSCGGRLAGLSRSGGCRLRIGGGGGLLGRRRGGGGCLGLQASLLLGLQASLLLGVATGLLLGLATSTFLGLLALALEAGALLLGAEHVVPLADHVADRAGDGRA
jgi:hypothetical protein